MKYTLSRTPVVLGVMQDTLLDAIGTDYVRMELVTVDWQGQMPSHARSVQDQRDSGKGHREQRFKVIVQKDLNSPVCRTDQVTSSYTQNRLNLKRTNSTE
jgi:hypothetical protein